MKSLIQYLREMEGGATPDNTLGMGNPVPATTTTMGTEPLVIKKCKKKKIKESILDDEDELENLEGHIKYAISQFLKDNYHGASKCKISEKPNEEGKYIVDCYGGLEVYNKEILTLTNEYFVFGKIKRNFYCNDCSSLTSLKGAPEEVGRSFQCSGCDSLTTLEGAPEKIGGGFYCYDCKSLTSLKGVPEKIVEDFQCYNCSSLTSLQGAPKKVGEGFYCNDCNSLSALEGAPEVVSGDFSCSYCSSLTSLKGAPKKVGGDFICVWLQKQFTEEDVLKVSKVRGEIIV